MTFILASICAPRMSFATVQLRGAFRSFDSVLRGDWIVTGDVNRDGSPDFVVASYDSSGIAVLTNDHGVLRVTQRIDVGRGFEGLAMGDFDGDGVSDLAASLRTDPGPSDSVIVLYRGTPPGRFDWWTNLQSGRSPIGVLASDLDGDGLADLACTNVLPWSVRLFRGIHGNPPVPWQTVTVLPGASILVSGDIDRDGQADLVVGGRGSTGALSLVRRTSSGGFMPELRVPGPEGTWAIALEDINGDGALDVLSGDQQTYSLAVQLGGPTGTFGYPDEYRFRQAFSPNALIVTDINQDARPDVLAFGSGSEGVRNLGVTFEPGLLMRAPQVTGACYADIDGDGRRDAVLATGPPATVAVLYGNADGTVGNQAWPVGIPVGKYCRSVAIADVDGDGARDIVLGNNEQIEPVTILKCDGRGHVIEQVNLGALHTPVVDIATGNFNADTWPDIVTLDDDGWVSLYLNLGAGQFGTPARFPVPNASSPLSLVVCDLDGDGFQDIATPTIFSRVAVLYGRGDGTFDAGQEISISVLPSGLASGDFNGDNLVDLAVTGYYTNRIVLILGSGGRTFQEQYVDSPVSSLSTPLVTDVNSDGRDDLVVLHGRQDILSLVQEQGVLTIRSTFHVTDYWDIEAMCAGDLDGDQVIDLAIGRLDANVVTTLQGDGTGAFMDRSGWGTGDGPWDVKLLDFDGDGLEDVVAACVGSRECSILLNDSRRSPVLFVEYGSRLEGAGCVIWWRTDSPSGLPVHALIQRASSPEGPFQELARVECQGTFTEYRDASMPQGVRSWYRVSMIDHTGRVAPPLLIVGPMSVTVRSAQLSPPRYGTAGTIEFTYALPGGHPEYYLDVYDVRGRRVLRLAEWPNGSATQGTIAWNPRQDVSRRLARGAYFVALYGKGAAAKHQRFLVR